MEPGESGRGLPQSKTWRKFGAAPANAKRLGVRQPSGALERGNQIGALSALLAASKQSEDGRILHYALERLFSCIHFGLDDCGNWGLNLNCMKTKL